MQIFLVQILQFKDLYLISLILPHYKKKCLYFQNQQGFQTKLKMFNLISIMEEQNDKIEPQPSHLRAKKCGVKSRWTTSVEQQSRRKRELLKKCYSFPLRLQHWIFSTILCNSILYVHHGSTEKLFDAQLNYSHQWIFTKVCSSFHWNYII